MNFFEIVTETTKKNHVTIRPDFNVREKDDLLIKGGAFYAVWDEGAQMWSTNIYDVARLGDQELYAKKKEMLENAPDETVVTVKPFSKFSSHVWTDFITFMKSQPDSKPQLDSKLTFQNTPVKKKDYVSKRLPYALAEGDYKAWDELVGTLYLPEERAKIEWAIGAIVSGDSRDIQKFLVLYGDAGAGKSTILKIIQKMFEGYVSTFDAKALTNSNNTFSTDVFRSNPLVAMQHDGDLSKIEDNTKLNSIVSHEDMLMSEKYKSSYTSRANAFLFMATNKPVKITDAKSGVIRRLIDVKPSGNLIDPDRYDELISQIQFELGAIAYHCLKVYKSMGKNYYKSYRPMEMIYKTDFFFNFVDYYYDKFDESEKITLQRAYAMYQEYCGLSNSEVMLRIPQFREELKNYYDAFKDVDRINGKQVRSVYSGFKREKFAYTQSAEKEEAKNDNPRWIKLDKKTSLFDELAKEYPAQYAATKDKSEIPSHKWSDVKTTLKDIDVKKVHYVKVPVCHIVIDFDLKDENGEKSAEKNLEAASKFPPTYAEFSKGGAGVHLHYIYEGDTDALAREYAPGIEIKVFNGNSSLRRRLSYCNDIPVAVISGGLPLREKKMVNIESVKSEKAMRELILRNLHKEIHPGTKPSIDFIYEILDKAYASGLHYDVTDMRPKIFAFAMQSTHQSDYCMKKVAEMKFRSEEASPNSDGYSKNELVFYDVEVFPNLFLVNWKYAGEDKKCVRMINPKPEEIETLLRMKLVGFNCRKYDNHMLYARYIGYTNQQLYDLSQQIITEARDAMFAEAYNLSYTDVYDFSSKKQSLKKFEIELGIHHQELGLPWDKPVPEEKWDLVAEYCDNDVIATEAVFFSKDRQQDFIARKILAKLAGGCVNDTTNQLTTRIIFGNEKHPQDQFVYPDLAAKFPGYRYEHGKSYMNDILIGEGGRVYAVPGIYYNVRTYDVASMHPHSITAENGFGPFTKRFEDLMNIRVAIKHKEYDKVREMFDGALAEYLTDEQGAKQLSSALKIAINSVYGLTAAKFDNKFRDPRNKDNWVAKRGALFMETLRLKVQEMGATVVHIKTDSIKIADPSPEIEQFIMDFGKSYGYDFEIESEYEKICLVNDAVYIARCTKNEKINGKESGHWTATGAQFAQPYVFKALFSKEDILFEDMCETKSVSSAIYLDMNESLPDVSGEEKMLEKLLKKGEEDQTVIDNLAVTIAMGHKYHFVGKVGLFCPIKPGKGGGLLMREKDGKYYSVGGSKGYRWLEAETVQALSMQDDIDRNYYEELCDSAIENISKYGDFEQFVSDDPAPKTSNPDSPPWIPPCGNCQYESCRECPHYYEDPYKVICELGYDISVLLKGEI